MRIFALALLVSCLHSVVEGCNNYDIPRKAINFHSGTCLRSPVKYIVLDFFQTKFKAPNDGPEDCTMPAAAVENMWRETIQPHLHNLSDDHKTTMCNYAGFENFILKELNPFDEKSENTSTWDNLWRALNAIFRACETSPVPDGFKGQGVDCPGWISLHTEGHSLTETIDASHLQQLLFVEEFWVDGWTGMEVFMYPDDLSAHMMEFTKQLDAFMTKMKDSLNESYKLYDRIFNSIKAVGDRDCQAPCHEMLRISKEQLKELQAFEKAYKNFRNPTDPHHGKCSDRQYTTKTSCKLHHGTWTQGVAREVPFMALLVAVLFAL